MVHVQSPEHKESLLRLRAVMERTGYSRSTLYKLIASGEMAPPIPLFGRSVAWLQSEVDAHIAAKIAAARKAA